MPSTQPTAVPVQPGTPATLGTVTPSASAMTSVSVSSPSAVPSEASITLTISASTDGSTFYPILSGVIPSGGLSSASTFSLAVSAAEGEVQHQVTAEASGASVTVTPTVGAVPKASAV